MEPWVDEALKKAVDKIKIENERLEGATPYIPYDGHYDDVYLERGADWWTNGFWGGILWQLYHYTGDRTFQESAIFQEKRLNKALMEFKDIHHDVGFLWLPTAVMHFQATGDKQSLRTGLHAANLLAGRLNLNGSFLVSWNDHPGWMIIDSMMNIQLLYWATEQTGDPRYAQIATKHADTVAKYLVREDGSTGHIASFNASTGEFVELLAGQGIDATSTWSRGNAWALYGFVLTYKRTKNARFLETAKKIADYFIDHVVTSEFIPLADFNDVNSMKIHDTSAGLIATCGLLEFAELDVEENDFYIKVAKKILESTLKNYTNFYLQEDGIVDGGTEAYYRPATYEVPLVYTDYFLVEALLRLKNRMTKIW